MLGLAALAAVLAPGRAMVAAAAAKAQTLGFAGLADVTAPNRTAAAAVRAALGQVGKPYRRGRPTRPPSTTSACTSARA